MKINKIILCLSAFFAFASCEKEIPFDYNSIEPILIIQAEFSISTSGSLDGYVHISYSQDVDSAEDTQLVDDATIYIQKKNGYKIPMKWDNGKYVIATISLGSETETFFQVSNEYKISVTVDGVEYIAECILQPKATFGQPYFIYQEVMPGFGAMMLRGSIQDVYGEQNFYKYSIQTPEIYQLGMLSDTGLDGLDLEFFIPFMPDADLGYPTVPGMEAAMESISEGQTIQINCFALDERPYNFLNILGSSTLNPPSQFDGALGYFSVYYENAISVTFRNEDVIVFE